MAHLSARQAQLVAVGVAALLVGLKSTTAWFSGSLALGAAALDSLIDTFLSAANVWVLRRAAAPPDDDHAYGHGKFENLAALGQGLFLTAAAAGLTLTGLRRLRSGAAPAESLAGMAVLLVAIGASFFVSRLLRRVAEREGSPALQADSIHYGTDLWTNGAALAALAVVHWTGWAPADPLVALGVAVYVFYAGGRLVFDALAVLSDRRLPAEELERIVALVATFRPRVVGMHDLRTRRGGGQRFIEMHLEIPRDTSFVDAHDLTVEVLRAVERELPRSKVFVHSDPV